MKNALLTLFLTIMMVGDTYCQYTTPLITITEGSPTNASGLGFSFVGEVMSDGDLYFRGSRNGLRDGIWKTDATPEGTGVVIEEANDFGGNWARTIYTDIGIVVQNSSNWGILEPGTSAFKPIAHFPDEYINTMVQSTDGVYYFTTRRDDNLILFTADASLSTSSEIGVVHPDFNNLIVTAGTEGAFIYNSNSFQDNFPKVYLSSTEELLELNDYLASYSLESTRLTSGYIYDKYLIISFQDQDNVFRNKIIDMTEGTSNDALSISEPLEYYEYENDIIIFTKREVVRLSTDDLTMQELYRHNFAFGTSTVNGDKMYVIGRENNEEGIVEIDLQSGTGSPLPNAITGSSFYSSEMLWHKNKFYYISNDREFNFLMTYDFDSSTPVVADTLSIHTGATVEHALEEVNNKLVISKRLGFLQHELFLYSSFPVGVSDEDKLANVSVYPSPATDAITLDMENLAVSFPIEVQISDIKGRTFSSTISSNMQIDVSMLSQGAYYGTFTAEGKVHGFNFLKL